MDAFDHDNETSTIAQSIGNQSDRTVVALRLINDALEQNLATGDADAASLMAVAALRLVFTVAVPSEERARLHRLMLKRGRAAPAKHPELADDLIAMALEGRKPDVVEAVKVTRRPPRHVTPINATAGG